MRTLLLVGLIACGDSETGPLDPPLDPPPPPVLPPPPPPAPPPINTDALCAETSGEYEHQVWRFEGGGVAVWMTRDIVGNGGGRTNIYEPRRFTLEREGRSDCVTDPSLMDYTWTHHNWDDEMEATADGLRWKLSMIHDFEGSGMWRYAIEGRDSSGQLVVGPLDLIVVVSGYGDRAG